MMFVNVILGVRNELKNQIGPFLLKYCEIVIVLLFEIRYSMYLAVIHTSSELFIWMNFRSKVKLGNSFSTGKDIDQGGINHVVVRLKLLLLAVVGQTVGSIFCKTMAYDYLCTLELSTSSMIATS